MLKMSTIQVNLKLLFVFVLLHIVECQELNGDKSETTSTVDRLLDYSSENNCVYNEEKAQESPWTATLRVQQPLNTAAIDYYACAILDAYTVVTYGRPFRMDMTTDKLAFLPWNSYTILIGAEKSGSNVTFSQSSEVSFVQPHPNYSRKINYQFWMFSQNDSVVIHLKTPLKFNSNLRPVCLPKIYKDLKETDQELNILYEENTTATIGGWKKYVDLEKTSLNVRLLSTQKCTTEWETRTRTTPIELPFEGRVCGLASSRPNKNNPGADCINKDSGVVVNHGGKYTFMGFVNTFYSVQGHCGDGAFFFIYRLSSATLTWLDATIRCGSSHYTCHNGECAPLESVCNQKNDCSDGSDEDPKYCRALHPCDVDRFECGTYGECIPKYIRGKAARNCDGISDCPLNEDEESCEVPNITIHSPTEKVISGVAIGVSVCLVLAIPATILIWRKLKFNKGWKLTDEDIAEFMEGCDVLENHSEIEKVANKPYDSEEHEIALENIEKGKLIGTGTFGDVYKGKLKSYPKSDRDCAIKIPKVTADPEQVKGFLKELKIMAHVGKHVNITHFMGAHTRSLREGILHIIVEYCELGSMEDFLKKYNLGFVNQLKPAPPTHQGPVLPGYVYVEMQMFSTADLIQWASQVAAGMAHLARKQVVHGDLAARNILIDGNRIAKICDFGLSHQLYTNISYLASPDARLPWKWMAVETLLSRALSTKSDVWSFGVTLWEMFTLGREPYENMLWDPSFAYALSSSGCPLEQPEYANSEIFQIMRNCWAVDPALRPDFEDITKQFTDELLQRH